MPGSIVWTPAVRGALNLRVINKFGAGFAAGSQRISGLLDACGPRTTDSELLVTLVLGKHFNLHRRDRDSDEVKKRGVNIYEQRAKLGNYADFLTINRFDVIYDKIDRVMATAETAGASAAEGPTRMVEALIPVALTIDCHTEQPFFSESHPVKKGSSDTFANVDDLGDLDFDAYDEAKRQFKMIPDEDGHACNSEPKILAVGPKFEAVGREIVENEMPKDFAGGRNLRTRDGVQLVVVPDWGDEFWCLLDTRMDSDMPFYFVEGRPLAVKPLYVDPNGAYEILQNELIWAVDGDMAVALGNPRRAFMAAHIEDAATIAATYAAKYELNDFGFDLA